MKLIIIICCCCSSCLLTVNCQFDETNSPGNRTNIFQFLNSIKARITNGAQTLIMNTRKKYNETVNYFKNLRNRGIEIQDSLKKLNPLETTNEKFIIEMELTAPQMIVSNGYPVEGHTIITDDGYLLTLHRIPNIGGQAVIIQHGILSSSADFLTSGGKRGLAYVLARAGYDVWLGNFRGNVYSKAHVNYSQSDAVFWNFTWHDIALHDLPAVIDYVNSKKASDKETLYIGHSMGNTALYALLSIKPEYNKKLKAAFSLAPVAYMTSLASPLRHFAPFVDRIETVLKSFGINEFLPHPLVSLWLSLGCNMNHYKERICENIIFLIAGHDEAQFDTENILSILSHSPAGVSVKTLIHFAQEIRDEGRFQQYNYGAVGNMEVYGSKYPPTYPVDKITLPVALFTSANDFLVGLPDAKRLYDDLPNAVELYLVPYKDFNHFDFLWGLNAQTVLYDHLLQVMDKFKAQEQQDWD